jgi:hypothetical protein
LDHDHTCQHLNVSGRRQVSVSGCPECIRGILCNDCNQNILPAIERGLDLGLIVLSEWLKEYLASRPFLEYSKHRSAA